jgi:hypothetical protein
MNVVKVMDIVIHCVPVVPGKLQGTWLDKLWDRIEKLAGGEGSEQRARAPKIRVTKDIHANWTSLF